MHKRSVNKSAVKAWIDRRGLAQASIDAKVSVSTLMNIVHRKEPIIPKRESILYKISGAMGLALDDVFPLEQDEAS